MSTHHLREIPVGGYFRWANAGTEQDKDRVTAEAINTGMTMAPNSVYSGGEEVQAILRRLA